MQYLTVDGYEYHVRLVYGSLRRMFSITEGPNSGISINARSIRDILGTSYTYTVNIEPDPARPEDYDRLYSVISSPVEYHSVVMPYGQTTLKFDAEVYTGTDMLGPTIGGVNRWNGLSITFRPIQPQTGVV